MKFPEKQYCISWCDKSDKAHLLRFDTPHGRGESGGPRFWQHCAFESAMTELASCEAPHTLQSPPDGV